MNTTYFKYMLLPTALLSTAAFAQDEADETAGQTKVNVAFRSVAAEDLLGGVSVLNYEDEVAGQNNETSLSNLQGYVSGFNGASLWGQSDYLVLVDGVPRDMSNVKPDEVAQITFMKGANAVVLYGSRAAKGAILVTTKRGNDEDLQINVSVNTGWNVAKSLPQWLGSAEYMSLYNEALINDGGKAKYDANTIYESYAGNNPYRYPNVDMLSSDYIKKAYNRTEVVAEIRGGAKRTHYYTNIGYNRSGDNLNFGEGKNDYTDRLNVRGNVDMQLADFVSAFADANVTMYSAHSPQGGDFWKATATVRPNRIVPFIPTSYLDTNNPELMSTMSAATLYDGMFLGTPSDATSEAGEFTNVIADSYAAGKSKYNSRHFEFTLGLNIDMEKVLKGLTFSTMFSVDYATSYTTSYTNEYATYKPLWSNESGEDQIIGITKINKDKKSGVQNISGSASNQTISFNAHFDYNRTFNDVHNVNAMLVANGWQLTKSGEYHKTSNANLGLLASYNYQHKYYAEFGSALIHSARLAEGHRKGFNTAYTVGYNIAKEAFMEGSIFDDLKLSASYSMLKEDVDISDFYMYAGDFNNADGAWWGWGAMDSQHSTNSKLGSNEDLDFVTRKEFSVNLQAALLKKSLTIDASFFRSTTEGLIISPTSQYPSYFSTGYPESTFIPNANYNNDKHMGFDLAINYKKQLTNDFSLALGANMTYYTTEATRRDDSQYADQYQYREGKALDTIWGYESMGLFRSQAEADAAPAQKIGAAAQAGDIRYKDQNGDGVIDTKDQVELGKYGWYGNPLTLGINLTAKYKGLSLFVLATGGFGAKGYKGDTGSNRNLYWQAKGEGKYSSVVRGRAIVDPATQTVTNYDTATYPRLTATDGANNYAVSDYWLYSTDQFNIAKVQLTYDLPASLFEGKIVKGVSVFANGANLLTIAKEKEILEMNIGSAPQNRFYQIGASVKF